jgi:hypothetical protein
MQTGNCSELLAEPYGCLQSLMSEYFWTLDVQIYLKSLNNEKNDYWKVMYIYMYIYTKSVAQSQKQHKKNKLLSQHQQLDVNYPSRTRFRMMFTVNFGGKVSDWMFDVDNFNREHYV